MPTLTSADPTARFYVTGGTLPPDATSYVERQADRDLLAALVEGEYCYVLNSRQMGKSSLCVRTMERLRERGVRTCFLDLTKYGGRNLTAEQWYAAMLADAGRELGLRQEFLKVWQDRANLGPMQRFFEALIEVGLNSASALNQSGQRRSGETAGRSQGPAFQTVVFIDEIDVTRSLPFSTDEFFAAIRQCYVGRATRSELDRLSFCLLGTATPADLIQDTRVSPFNIGQRIEVRDFTPEEAAPLAAGLTPLSHSDGIPRQRRVVQGVGGEGAVLLDRILYWTGGHPYLTQRLCRAVAQVGGDGPRTIYTVDSVCQSLFLTHTAKESDDNLAFVRNRLVKSDADLAALLDLYAEMRSGKRVADDETNPLSELLKLSGVARVERGELRVRNRIYEHVFDRSWVERHMPDAEKRRQRTAYRRGLARAAGFSLVICLAIGALALYSYRNARSAIAARDQARLATSRESAQRRETQTLLYAADMSAASEAISNGNGLRAREILKAYLPKKDALTEGRDLRGWEWYHLWRRARKGDANHTWDFGAGVIYGFCATEDRSRAAIACRSGRVWLLDLKSHTARAIGEHRGGAICAAISPNGRFLASGGLDGMLRLWDIPSGREALPARKHPFPVTTLAFSPDGQEIATGAHPVDSNLIQNAAVSGNLVDAGSIVRFWRLTSAAPARTAKLAGSRGVYALAYAHSGRVLAASSIDPVVYMVDPKTARVMTVLREHPLPVRTIAFSPDDRMMVTGGNDIVLRLWRVSGFNARVVSRLPGHGGIVRSATFSSDGSRLATAGDDGTVHLWDVDRTGPLTHETGKLLGHTDIVMGLAFNDREKTVYSAGFDGTVRTWSVTADQAERWGTLPAGGGVVFSPDTTRLAVSSAEALGVGNGVVLFFDSYSGSMLPLRLRHRESLSRPVYSPDGSRLLTLTGTWRPSVRAVFEAALWDLRTGRKTVLLQQKVAFTQGAFDPEGRVMAAGDGHGVLRIWDSNTLKLLSTDDLHSGFLGEMRFTADGKRLVIGTGSGHVVFWDVGNRTIVQRLAHPPRSGLLMNTIISDDNRFAASMDFNGVARIWDLQAKGQAREMILSENVAAGMGLAFSPDAKRPTLAAGYQDGSVRLWSLQTMPPRPVAILRGPHSAIGSVSFSPDGRLLAAGCADPCIYVWRAAVPDEISSR